MFKEDKQIGVIGEYVVFNELMNQKSIKRVHDVRADKRFQAWEVDFLVEDINRQFTWLEVKTDLRTYDTGNIIYEKTSFGKDGCMERTKADVIAFYVPQSGNIYLCNTEALRKCARQGDYPVRPIGDGTLGMIIPVGDLERFGVVTKMIQSTVLEIERKKE